jgi:hypothetical protein
MHSKIINPNRDGRFVFANRGSCNKTVSYLNHEAKDQGKEAVFFNAENNKVSSAEVQASIDENAKGLRKSQEKFYSLVLSPSEEELRHFGGDAEKLKAYTRIVMENYAANFSLKSGKSLKSKDLLWYATLHRERQHKEGSEKGISKPGAHQHVHVLVSAQDRNGKHRLNPRGRKSHFVFKEWQIKNGQIFQQMFNYAKPTISDKLTAGMPEQEKQRHRERIQHRISYLNEHFVGSKKLDLDRVDALADQQQYGKGFFFHLHRLSEHYQQGRIIRDPYHVLEKGKDRQGIRGIFFPGQALLSMGKSSQRLGQEAGDEELGITRKKRQQELER